MNDTTPDPIRRVATTHPAALTHTSPGDRLLGPRRYSSHVALVLSGGGARAAYQVGVVAGLAERLPHLTFPIVTGVSAGAINAAFLAAHHGTLPEAVAGLRERWRGLTADVVFHMRPGGVARAALRAALAMLPGRRIGPMTVRGILDTMPLRHYLERHIDLSAIEANLAEGRLRAVALTATSFTTGRSVTFVHGAPGIPMWHRVLRESTRVRLTVEHIMASAAIPITFPAVRLGDEFYGDGGVRQMAPLAPALHLGARAVLAVGVRVTPPRSAEPPGDYPSAAAIIGLLFDTIFLDALEADAERLERVNALLDLLPSGTEPPDGLRPVNLLLVRPSRPLGPIAAAHVRRLPARVRWLVRQLGGEQAGAEAFVSYLLFEPTFTSELIDMGYQDVAARWPMFEEFFSKLERSQDPQV